VPSAPNPERPVPAKNPRLAVYLPRHVLKTVQRCAAMRGVSRSALVAEILTEAQPVLDRVASLLDLAARTDKSALKEWAATLEMEQAGIEKGATAVLARAEGVFGRVEAGLTQKAPAGARRSRARRTPGQ